MRSIRPLVLAFALSVLSLAPAAAEEPAESPDASEPPRVEMATSMGTIVLELHPDKAPVTVKNFLGYVQDGFYKGTVFHRVIKGFMVQGGGFDEELNLRPPAGTITNEADNGLSNERGTIAMARRNTPHSATSQFFINHVDNKALDHKAKHDSATWGYAVFGRVVAGMEVVDAIAETPTGVHPKGMGDVPREAVVIDDVVWVNAPPSERPTVTLDGGAG